MFAQDCLFRGYFCCFEKKKVNHLCLLCRRFVKELPSCPTSMELLLLNNFVDNAATIAYFLNQIAVKTEFYSWVNMYVNLRAKRLEISD